MKKQWLGIVVSFLIGLSCSDKMPLQIEYGGNRLQVLSVISPAFEYIEVYVGESTIESSPAGVLDATVLISDSIQTVQLDRVQPGLYRLHGKKMLVRPRQSYTLHVHVPNHDDFTAITTIPGTPEFLNYQSGDTVKIENYWGHYYHVPTIEFHESYQASLYRLLLFPDNNQLAYSAIETDSGTVEFPAFTPQIDWSNDTLICQPAKLQLWAMDSSASLIDNNQTDMESNQIAWNLFGSMTMSEIDIIIEFKFRRDND